MSKRWVVIDFETASGANLKKTGAYAYAENPTTEITALAWEDDCGRSNALSPSQLIQESGGGRLYEYCNDPEVTFIAHNVQFERAIWRHLMHEQYGWPDIPIERWHDTMAVALMKGMPAKLDILARALRLGHEKDMMGSKLAISLSKPHKKTGELDRTPETMQKVLEYCAQDVKVEVAALKRLQHFTGGERQVWELDQRINDRGIRLDTDYIRSCLYIVDQSLPPLLKEFADLTGGLTPTQGAKFKDWLTFNGCELPNLQKETVSRLIEKDEEEQSNAEPEWADANDEPTLSLSEPVRRALRIRSIAGSASIKKLDTMLQCQGMDGRARGLLQYHGAGPGRWAGRILQPHNFPRAGVSLGDGGAVEPSKLVAAIMERAVDYLVVLLGEPIEAVIAGLRHALISDRDKTFLIGDFAQIEARVVLALAGQHDAVKTFVDGDPYCAMAESIFKHPVTKKEHPEKRQTGKNTILACGFGMGFRTFMHRYCPKETQEFAQGCIDAYRKDLAPKVPELWYGLERASTRAVWDGKPQEFMGIRYAMEGSWLTCRLPSGRKLWYFEPQRERRHMPWDFHDIRPSWSHMTFKAGRWLRRDAYGGLLTENVVQAMARDLLVHNMFTCEREGLPIVLTVHDEVVVEDIADHAKMFNEIMHQSPQWAKEYQIPIAIEMMVSERYRK
jgi:DNA polymerase